MRGLSKLPVFGCGILAAGVLTALLAGDAFAQASAGGGVYGSEDRESTLVIGKVAKSPKRKYGELKTMADFVLPGLRDLGIGRVRVLVARDNAEMTDLLRTGAVDWGTDSIASAAHFVRQGAAVAIAQAVPPAEDEKRSVFFTRDDGEIGTLEDLAGHTIAFEDPGSTSAFVVPATVLLDRGLELEFVPGPGEEVSPGKVGFVFARDEPNITIWVLKGIVDAGAYSSRDWESERNVPAGMRGRLRVIHRTAPYPDNLWFVRSGLDPRIRDRLREILAHAHQTPEGRKALEDYGHVRRFETDPDILSRTLATADRFLERLRAGLGSAGVAWTDR